MGRFLIHIGPHKTGTTYLQHAFTAMRPALLSRGICYPEDWGSIHGHHVLTEQLQRQEKPALRRALDLLAARFDTVLLSSETFSLLADHEVADFREVLGGHPATIVFYLRRASELIPSTWRENVKAGAQQTLPGFVAECLGVPAVSSLANGALVLDRYSKCFGSPAMRVASYSAVVDSGEDLLVHFCRNFLDWPDPPPNQLGQVNASLEMVDTEILRGLNALEWQRSGNGGVRLFHRYMALKPTLPIADLVQGPMLPMMRRLRIDDGAPSLAQLRYCIAEAYRHALVPPCPGGQLMEPRITETHYVHSDYLLRPGATDFLRAIHERLLAAEGIP